MPAKNETGMLDAYLEQQTSRLTVTDNYIWTIIAVTWVMVVSSLLRSRWTNLTASYEPAYPMDPVGLVCG
jgi:hypothetical protein